MSEESAVTKRHVTGMLPYHLIAEASDMPTSELSETSSSVGRGRFLATPFGQAPNHASGSSEKSSTSWKLHFHQNIVECVPEKYDPSSPDASVIRDWLPSVFMPSKESRAALIEVVPTTFHAPSPAKHKKRKCTRDTSACAEDILGVSFGLECWFSVRSYPVKHEVLYCETEVLSGETRETLFH